MDPATSRNHPTDSGDDAQRRFDPRPQRAVRLPRRRTSSAREALGPDQPAWPSPNADHLVSPSARLTGSPQSTPPTAPDKRIPIHHRKEPCPPQ